MTWPGAQDFLPLRLGVHVPWTDTLCPIGPCRLTTKPSETQQWANEPAQSLGIGRHVDTEPRDGVKKCFLGDVRASHIELVAPLVAESHTPSCASRCQVRPPTPPQCLGLERPREASVWA